MARFASPVALLATAALLALMLTARFTVGGRPDGERALSISLDRHGAPSARPDGAALDRTLSHRPAT